MHKLLKRQISKYLTPEQEKSMASFLATINETYGDFEKSHELLERSTELSSDELFEANAELRLRSMEIETLYKILTMTNEASTLEEVYGKIIDEVQTFTKFPVVRLSIYDQEAGILELVGHHSPSATMAPAAVERHALDQTPDGLVLLGEDDFYQADHMPVLANGSSPGNEMHTFLSFAMYGRGAPVGVLSLAHDKENAGNPRLIGWLRAVADQIGSIIDRKKMSETLATQEAKMVSASRMSELGKMAGGIAHEINTPLAIITLLSEQLGEQLNEKTPDIPLCLENSKIISKTAMRIAKIITGLRTFSRDGQRDPFTAADVRTVIDETIAFCSEKFRQHQVELKINVTEGLMISCRITQISQVILNLLNNAYDAVESLPEKWVHLDAEERNGCLEISVTDSGSGIPQEIRAKLFNPFFTTKVIGKGTGLGLSISTGIIKDHRGSLTYDETSTNTRFVITLPLMQNTQPGPKSA